LIGAAFTFGLKDSRETIAAIAANGSSPASRFS
jgi:hypothetical protein